VNILKDILKGAEKIIFGITQVESVNVFERLSVELGEMHIVQISFAILMEHIIIFRKAICNIGGICLMII
jgi:hypothetical protein